MEHRGVPGALKWGRQKTLPLGFSWAHLLIAGISWAQTQIFLSGSRSQASVTAIGLPAWTVDAEPAMPLSRLGRPRMWATTDNLEDIFWILMVFLALSWAREVEMNHI